METNRYANDLLSKSTVKDKSRLKRWVNTTNTKMKTFIGLLFIMGLVKKSRLAKYWSTDPIIATPFFNQIMPRDRFELLLRCWHFCNNDLALDDDRLFKLKDICNALLDRFQALHSLLVKYLKMNLWFCGEKD